METKMGEKRYIVKLSEDERKRLEELIRNGKSAAKPQLRARILLKADETAGQPGWNDTKIAEAWATSSMTCYRVRQQRVEDGLAAVLRRKPRATPALARIFDGEKEARLTALACAHPPPGRARWTLRLLAEKGVELGSADHASHSPVGLVLKKTLANRILRNTGSFRRRRIARS